MLVRMDNGEKRGVAISAFFERLLVLSGSCGRYNQFLAWTLFINKVLKIF